MFASDENTEWQSSLFLLQYFNQEVNIILLFLHIHIHYHIHCSYSPNPNIKSLVFKLLTLASIVNIQYVNLVFLLQLVTSDTSSVSDTGRDDQQSVISAGSDLHPPMPRTVGIGDSRPPSFQ